MKNIEILIYPVFVKQTMANEEHKDLAQFLKEVHSSIRIASSKMGAEQAWQEHCENKNILKMYAHCMEKLATTHWAKNCANESNEATSRIQWAADICYDYFIKKSSVDYRNKELEIVSKSNIVEDTEKIAEECFSQPIKLIDVGSCYNPFQIYDFLDVFPIDLCPANSSVLECDFLKVPIGETLIFDSCKVMQIAPCYFDAVTFCFLLEYIPTSDLRLVACERAYDVLKPGGLLIINTPDSKHVGANSKTMKCWRFTLGNIGFTRIKYEKLKHMHCMVFRKALYKATAVRWSTLHKESYMEHCLHIPQDMQTGSIECPKQTKIEISSEDFQELPFCNDTDLT